ncbi:MAG: bifunctional folylpolyglutamate synthase/dihydrofolate synthase [Halioglobus sp.]|nr:bifunctional folylpolyglutamate synthase/dihydrofolate synthase [Halioglobus sp.]
MTKASLAQWLGRLEQLHPRAVELGLERVGAVAATLGLLPLPQPVVTVAGTNGKGSVVAVLEALLGQTGRRAGAFTSPHLLRFNERIRVGAEEVPDEDIVAAFEAIERARGDISLTYFEFATLAALLVFRQRAPDIVILEVGLGGRLDSVNIVDASVAVITSIDIDHQDWLGESRSEIALEKAGILRAARPAVIADPKPPAALLARAAKLGAAPVLCLGREFTLTVSTTGWQATLRTGTGAARVLPPLPHGALLPHNVCAALQAALLLGVSYSDEQVVEALRRARPHARREAMSVAGRDYVLDVAHNPAAVVKLLEYICATPCKGRTLALFSVMADKDIAGMTAAAAGRFDAWYLPDQPDNARAASAADVAALLRRQGQGALSEHGDIARALTSARTAMGAGDRLVIFGSFSTVAAALALLEAEQGVDNARSRP